MLHTINTINNTENVIILFAIEILQTAKKH